MSDADARTYAAFGGAVLIGGANFVAVSFSNMELPPLYGATLRFAAAALLFLVIARLAGAPMPAGRARAGAVAYGMLGIGIAYALMYYALVGLSAGTTAVIAATVPLFTLLVAVLLGQERLTARGVAGALLALAGIAVLSLDRIGAAGGASYFVAAVIGAVAIAVSSVVARGCRDVHPLRMNAIGMSAGTVLLAAGSLALGEPWRLPAETRTWTALLWLVALGSVGLFQLFLYVVRRWSASATVYVLAGMPIVAAGLGVALLDQPLTTAVVGGAAIVILAVWIGTGSRGAAGTPPPPPEPVTPRTTRAFSG